MNNYDESTANAIRDKIYQMIDQDDSRLAQSLLPREHDQLNVRFWAFMDVLKSIDKMMGEKTW